MIKAVNKNEFLQEGRSKRIEKMNQNQTNAKSEERPLQMSN